MTVGLKLSSILILTCSILAQTVPDTRTKPVFQPGTRKVVYEPYSVAKEAVLFKSADVTVPSKDILQALKEACFDSQENSNSWINSPKPVQDPFAQYIGCKHSSVVSSRPLFGLYCTPSKDADTVSWKCSHNETRFLFTFTRAQKGTFKSSEPIEEKYLDAIAKSLGPSRDCKPSSASNSLQCKEDANFAYMFKLDFECNEGQGVVTCSSRLPRQWPFQYSDITVYIKPDVYAKDGVMIAVNSDTLGRLEPIDFLSAAFGSASAESCRLREDGLALCPAGDTFKAGLNQRLSCTLTQKQKISCSIKETFESTPDAGRLISEL